MGRIPDFFMLAKDVLRPIAARAQTIRNLLVALVAQTTSAGIEMMLATIDMARNPRINQGKIFLMLKFALSSLLSAPERTASLLFRRSLIKAKVITAVKSKGIYSKTQVFTLTVAFL